MWINAYVFAAALGSILIAASLFGGGDQGGSEGIDHDGDLEPTGDGATHGDLSGFLATFLSLRFWSFFAAFFGLTGWVTDGLNLLPGEGPPLMAAIATGLASGTIAVRTIRSLQQGTQGTVPGPDDYVGQSARVLVPFGPGQLGKVRLELRGNTVDILARTEGSGPLATGDRVLIIALEGVVAAVVRE